MQCQFIATFELENSFVQNGFNYSTCLISFPSALPVSELYLEMGTLDDQESLQQLLESCQAGVADGRYRLKYLASLQGFDHRAVKFLKGRILLRYVYKREDSLLILYKMVMLASYNNSVFALFHQDPRIAE